MSENTWTTISWPSGYVDNNLEMSLAERPKCISCSTPLRKQKEVNIEGTVKHRGRHLCEKCYQLQLDSGEFIARARADKTDTHIKCMKCGKFKPHDKFKRLTGTFRVRRDYTCSLCRKLWERYRTTPVQYEEMLIKQDYKCAICRTTFNEDQDRAVHVDHDHSCCNNTSSGLKSCGKCVRGLLCGRYNVGLGALDDSEENLKRAIKYIKDHNDKQ